MPTIICQACNHHNPHNTAEERFWNQVDKSGDCWIWIGAHHSGYGNFSTEKGACTSTHRFSYELKYGPIPDGMFVCHKCDNPPCCNPDHLFLGTPLDNSKDMIAKGRYIHLVGEEVSTSKVTNEEVIAIRAELIEGASRSVLAKKYGVSRDIIAYIATGRTWSHMGPPIEPVKADTKKLDADSVRKIRKLREDGWSYTRIGKLFEIHHSTVGRIIRGLYWKDVK